VQAEGAGCRHAVPEAQAHPAVAAEDLGDYPKMVMQILLGSLRPEPESELLFSPRPEN